MVDRRKQEVLGAMTQKPHTAHRSTPCPHAHEPPNNTPKPDSVAASKHRSASRVICTGRMTKAEIICSLKHYWRFVDSEAFELKALSQGMDEEGA
jgi:hypothetical protein